MKMHCRMPLLLALAFKCHAGYAARLLQTDDVVGLGNLELADDVIAGEVRETLEGDGKTTGEQLVFCIDCLHRCSNRNSESLPRTAWNKQAHRCSWPIPSQESEPGLLLTRRESV